MVYAQMHKYRITLDLEVMEDFDPKDLDWDTILNLEGGEHLEVDVKELNTDNIW